MAVVAGPLIVYQIGVRQRVRFLLFLLLLQGAGVLQAATSGTLRLQTFRQLPVAGAWATDPSPVASSTPGRLMLKRVAVDELGRADLALRAVPLPKADMRAAEHFRGGRFGVLLAPDGIRLRFNPEVVLVRFRGCSLVSAIAVRAGDELAAAIALSKRADVEFSELDLWEYPAYQPNDPLLTYQWHHGVLHSFQAWDFGLGGAAVKVAIVDTPFQMDHPDLAARTSPGWDIVLNQPITASAGIEHSTLAAGLAGGIIGNGVGIAGAGNCQLLPISISDTGDTNRTVISEMYDAVIWAADHDVRVVNMSWTGGDSDTLNAAGAYLKEHARGLLVMAAGNRGVPAYTTNQPDIYCVSMTDSADNMSSLAGVQVDFAAPGWEVYSTTVKGGYAYAYGTSYSSPLLAGIIGQLFSINPLLGPNDVVEILKSTSADLGPPGRDDWFGWGRIDFGAAARQAHSRLPRIDRFDQTVDGFSVSTAYNPAGTYSLYRSSSLESGTWSLVPATTLINGGTVTLSDTAPLTGPAFYRISVSAP